MSIGTDVDVTLKTIRLRGIPVPIFFALLTGSLLIGMAQVAQTPTFEGFDDIAHYPADCRNRKRAAFGDLMSAEVEAVGQFIPLSARGAAVPLTVCRALVFALRIFR